MGKRKPAAFRSRPQPTFSDSETEQPGDKPAEDPPALQPPLLPEGIGSTEDSQDADNAAAANNGPKPPRIIMKTQFGLFISGLANIDQVLEDEQQKSLVKIETLHITVLKNLKRMLARWEDMCKKLVIDEALWHRPDIYYERGRLFLRLLLLAGKGRKGRSIICYSTLTGWCTTFIRQISRYCVDTEGNLKGSSLLRHGLKSGDEGFFNLIIMEAKKLFKEYNLDRAIPDGVFWGRFEVQLIIETLLASTLSMELAMQYCLSISMAAVTALRPGALGWSHKEWNGGEGNESKFMQNKDLIIERDHERGRGAFVLHLKVRHIKAQNDDQMVKHPTFNLRSHSKAQNAIFDPVNYIVPLLHHRGELIDYVGKPYSAVLDGKEIRLAIGNPEHPVFRASKHGGTGVDGTRAASASSINRRIVEAAIKAELRPAGGCQVGSTTSIRKDRAWEFADLYGQTAANELLGHEPSRTVQSIHYDVGVSRWDLTGIFLRERDDGDQDRHRTALALNLYRQSALRSRIALRMRDDLTAEADSSHQPQDQFDDNESAQTGSKRKASTSSKVKQDKGQRHRPNEENEEAKIKDSVEALPEVKNARGQADEAWRRLYRMTNLPLSRGNNWRHLLTEPGDEPIPEGWDASSMKRGWGTETERQKLARLYSAANDMYLAVRKKKLKDARREHREQKDKELQALKERGNLDHMQAVLDEREAPSKLLHHAVAHLPREADPDDEPTYDPDDPYTSNDQDPGTDENLNDREARFFLSTSTPPEHSPLYDIVNTHIYGAPSARLADPQSEPVPPDSSTGLSAPPLVKDKSKAKKPTTSKKNTGKSSKGKEKADQSSIASGNPPPDNDGPNEAATNDRYDLDSPWQSKEIGEFFDESQHSLFDTRRAKELETLLERHTGEDFRVAWQLHIVALLETDEALATKPCAKCPESNMTYCRAKLLRHNERVHHVLDPLFNGISYEEFERQTRGIDDKFKCPLCRKSKGYSTASYLLRHIAHNCKNGLCEKVELNSKRRKNNLGESTSTQATRTGAKSLPSRPAARSSNATTSIAATEAHDPTALAGPSTHKARRTATKRSVPIEIDEDSQPGGAKDEDYVHQETTDDDTDD
ncbi:hypothetical protein FRB90_011466 [Tulasnella sp. 427]|nr:hypothetical protein FRB90_011466 [Tulasnella sp. 427]